MYTFKAKLFNKSVVSTQPSQSFQMKRFRSLFHNHVKVLFKLNYVIVKQISEFSNISGNQVLLNAGKSRSITSGIECTRFGNSLQTAESGKRYPLLTR